MKITVVTPCRNSARYIRETVDSVLAQYALKSGRVTLQFIICDGASTDDTIQIVRKIDSPSITLISEPDGSMYEALAKGLSLATGDIVAYLNAGDYYHPGAFDVIADVFQLRSVSWVTGYGVFLNEAGSIVDITLPYRYRKRLFECGAYGRWLPFVMQETTFWRRELSEKVDLQMLAKHHYAGDYFLWRTFCGIGELHVVQAVLGGFRRHDGQLSENLRAYRDEVLGITRRPTIADFALMAWDSLFWFAPAGTKKFLNRNGFLRYDFISRRWL